MRESVTYQAILEEGRQDVFQKSFQEGFKIGFKEGQIQAAKRLLLI